MLLRETLIMQSFYINFRKAFADYVQGQNGTESLRLKNIDITLPPVSRLASKGVHPPPIARYPARPMKFYAQYILPPAIYARIIWAEETDAAFLEYLKAKEYFFLIG